MYTEFKKEKNSKIFFDNVKEIKRSGNNSIIEDDEEDKEIENILSDIKFNEKKANKINNNKKIEEETENIIIEIDKEKNDDYEYIFSIKLSELIKGKNKFQLFIYYYYFYNQ